MTKTDEFDTIAVAPDETESISRDRVFYVSEADSDDLVFALSEFLKLPKAKFSPRYPRIERLRNQFKVKKN